MSRGLGDVYKRQHSADTDVVVASANAYVNALNRLIFTEKKDSIHPQRDAVEKKGKV